MFRAIPNEELQVLRQKYEAGGTLPSLAIEYHTTASTIRDALLRAGGTPRPRGRRRGSGAPKPPSNRVTREQMRAEGLERARQAADLVDQGLTTAEVGKRLGITKERARQLYVMARGKGVGYRPGIRKRYEPSPETLQRQEERQRAYAEFAAAADAEARRYLKQVWKDVVAN